MGGDGVALHIFNHREGGKTEVMGNHHWIDHPLKEYLKIDLVGNDEIEDGAGFETFIGAPIPNKDAALNFAMSEIVATCVKRWIDIAEEVTDTREPHILIHSFEAKKRVDWRDVPAIQASGVAVYPRLGTLGRWLVSDYPALAGKMKSARPMKCKAGRPAAPNETDIKGRIHRLEEQRAELLRRGKDGDDKHAADCTKTIERLKAGAVFWQLFKIGDFANA